MHIALLLWIIHCWTGLPAPAHDYPCFFNESKKWQLVSYQDLTSHTETPRPWNYHKLFDIIIQFDYDEQIEAGTFEGQSLSNIILGSYTLTEDGIVVDQFDYTNMREPAWGIDSLRIAMNTVSMFRCNEDTLFLYYNAGKNAMVFLKTETPFYDWDEYLQSSSGSTSID